MNKYLKLTLGLLVAAVAALFTPVGPAMARVVGTWEYPLLLLTSSQTLTVQGPASFSGAVTITGATNLTGPFPSVQTVASSGTINADACGGFKQVTASVTVETSSITVFGTPAASGCVFDMVNVGTNTIKLKFSTNTLNMPVILNGLQDLTLNSSDTVRMGWTGSAWYQIGPKSTNQ